MFYKETLINIDRLINNCPLCKIKAHPLLDAQILFPLIRCGTTMSANFSAIRLCVGMNWHYFFIRYPACAGFRFRHMFFPPFLFLLCLLVILDTTCSSLCNEESNHLYRKQYSSYPRSH